METSQPICKANQLAGFHTIRAFTGRFLHTANSNNNIYIYIERERERERVITVKKTTYLKNIFDSCLYHLSVSLSVPLENPK